mgnify:CR=1 FL=1
MESRRELNERLLPDDYPIYAGYVYVADGKPIVSDWHEITAAQLRRRIGAAELRRCDLAGRGLL